MYYFLISDPKSELPEGTRYLASQEFDGKGTYRLLIRP